MKRLRHFKWQMANGKWQKYLHHLTFALCLLPFAMSLAVRAWAGTDMESASYKIRRSDINSGGSNHPASATYKLTDTAGTGGGTLFSGTTYFVYSGFSNIVSNPNTIEDLAVITGPTSTSMVLSWTAPTAYGSTGTATAYDARQSATPFSDELSFVNATVVVNAWSPLPPGALETRTVSGLSSNTTYYFAVKGVDQAGNTGYISNNSGASTLTDAVTGIDIVNVYESSVTLSWTGLGGSNAEGYVVQGSTVPGFGGAVHSIATADGTVTTLTVTGLRRGALNYFRVGGLNWNAVANFVIGPSTITLPGPPPINPTLEAVNASSITLVWGVPPSDDGYSAEASVDDLFTTISQSSVTADVTVSTLTIQNLVANATYYLRVGSLYDDATNYAYTTPASTITVAAIPTSGVIGAVTPSSITISWNGSINEAGTQFQAEVSSISSGGPVVETIVTGSLTASFTGLTQDTTYWAQVKALGWAGADSPYLIVGSSITGVAITPLIIPTFAGFTDVELSSVTVAWIPTGGPTIAYDVDLAPADPFGAQQFLTAVAGSSATLTGLNIDSLYSARVRAHSLTSGHVSAYSNYASTYTLAEPPLSLSTTEVSNVSVWLAWNGNGNPANALYSIERSTDGITFNAIGDIRTASYQDPALIEGTAYSYRVRAINENGVPTAYSNIVSVTTSGTPTAPKVPDGFWAEGQTLGSSFQITYNWSPVTERVDGSALINLAGYQIFVSSNILAPENQWTLVTTVTGASWSTSAAPGSTVFYALRAIDTNGMTSGYTHAIDDSAELVHYFMSADGFTRATVPQNAANVLRRQYNSFGTDLSLQWVEVPSEETGFVVRSMTLEAISDNTGSVVSDVAINPPTLVGIIGYSVSNGQVVSGVPQYSWMGTASSPSRPIQSTLASASAALIPAAQAGNDLSLFWYDGVEWIKTTGEVDMTNNAVSFTGSQMGRFQIRIASHASTGSQITLTKVYPRIITPNGDGWNDKAIFQFDNPQLLPLSGEIYDITGSKVAGLKAGPNPDSTLMWDGKNVSGAVVPAGIYVYQIDVGGSPQSGTIVVAR